METGVQSPIGLESSSTQCLGNLYLGSSHESMCFGYVSIYGHCFGIPCSFGEGRSQGSESIPQDCQSDSWFGIVKWNRKGI